MPGAGAENLPAGAPTNSSSPSRAVSPGAPPCDWDAASSADFVAETGPVRPTDVDHTGAILFEDIIRRVTFSSHGQLTRLGLHADYAKENGIGRMA